VDEAVGTERELEVHARRGVAAEAAGGAPAAARRLKARS
jgi:hypothetical protein